MDRGPIRVLFLCTGNSARSQMAEALLRRLGGESFEVGSAGIDPRGIDALTYAAMAEIGEDLAGHSSKGIDSVAGDPFDYVFTLCGNAAERCPATLARRGEMQHWPLDDPVAATGTEAERLDEFRRVRDEIETRIASWLEQLDLGRPAGTTG